MKTNKFIPNLSAAVVLFGVLSCLRPAVLLSAENPFRFKKAFTFNSNDQESLSKLNRIFSFQAPTAADPVVIVVPRSPGIQGQNSAEDGRTIRPSIGVTAAAPLRSASGTELRPETAAAPLRSASGTELRPETAAANATGLNAYFIAVGQGDSEYIELPNGKTVLIDGGPANPSGYGDPLIAEFLNQHGISKIDYVVLTHPHTDHFTGLQYVLDHVQVGHFYDTGMDNPGAPGLRALRDQIRNAGITVTYPAAGDELDWGTDEVGAKVFNSCPNPGQSSNSGVLNDCSIVLKVTYQNTSILYTGDIRDGVESVLVSKYASELEAEVLKVSHHGSPHASGASFLRTVKPKEAFIEVGSDNPYGHPSPAALSRLEAVGAVIHRTDLDGTQEYTIGGQAELTPSN